MKEAVSGSVGMSCFTHACAVCYCMYTRMYVISFCCWCFVV